MGDKVDLLIRNARLRRQPQDLLEHAEPQHVIRSGVLLGKKSVVSGQWSVVRAQALGPSRQDTPFGPRTVPVSFRESPGPPAVCPGGLAPAKAPARTGGETAGTVGAF